MNDILGLDGKSVVITGAGKGIGREAAKVFSSLGCKVAALSRTADDLASLAAEIDKPGSEFLTYHGDAADPGNVREFADRTLDAFGRVDVLVNNAGMRFRRKFLDITHEEWSRVHAVNLGSVFLCCQAFGPGMIENRSGRIINLSSIIGTLGLPDLVGYGASKGAILGLTKSLALEWAPYGVTVNAVAPGFCETSYSEKFRNESGLYDFTIERTPMGRWGSSSEATGTIIYLASDLASYVTGEVAMVDGGWSAW